MQYPPIDFLDGAGVLQKQPDIGPEILETVPPVQNRRALSYDLVHFDLDPSNSMYTSCSYLDTE